MAAARRAVRPAAAPAAGGADAAASESSTAMATAMRVTGEGIPESANTRQAGMSRCARCEGAHGGAPCTLSEAMGEVVRLEGRSEKDRKTVGKPPRRRGRRSRTALVLGGGGFTGGVYQIGALRALDLLAVNRTVNQFDVYVGTSAGSFVASLLANGVTPEEMMRVVNQQVPTPFRDVDRGTLMRPNYLEFLQATALLPLRMLGLARTFAGQIRSTSVVDVAVGLAEALPSGVYDGP